MDYNRVDKGYISSISLLDQREILNQVLDIQNEEWNFLDIMELLGKYEVTANPVYHNYVNESVYVLADVAAAGGAAGATSVTVTFDAVTGMRVGQLCFDNNATYPVVGRVYSINTGAKTAVIKSVDGATDLTFVNAKPVPFFSNAAGEGSGSPDPIRTDLTKYLNQVQIFKEKFSITDIQKVSRIEVEYGGDNYYLFKGQHDALTRFRSDIGFAMLFSQISNDNFADGSSSTLDDADGNPVQTTRGLDQYIEDYGISESIAGASIAKADFATIDAELDKRRAPAEYLILASSLHNRQYDDMFMGMNATALPDALYTNAKNGLEVNLEVDAWRLYGRTYKKKWLPALDHKNVTSFTNVTFGYNDTSFLLPEGKIKVDGGGMVDRFRVRYMDGDGTDLRYREWMTGGLAPVPTGDEAVLNINYSSVMGLEILGAEHFAKLK